jgi:hypothetical protein
MTEETTVAAVEVVDTNPVKRWTGVLASPTKTFEGIAKKPTWLIALLIMAVFVVAMSHVMAPLQINAVREHILTDPDIPDEAREQILERVEGQMEGTTAVVLWRTVVPFAAVFVMMLIIAGIYLFSVNLLFGGQGNYKGILSTLCWESAVVGPIMMIIKSGYALITSQPHGLVTSLAALPFAEPGTFLYDLLGKVDIFTIWSIVLLTLGFTVVGKIKPQKAAWSVLVIYIFWWALILLLTHGLGINIQFGGM